jgi:hypothetical protein
MIAGSPFMVVVLRFGRAGLFGGQGEGFAAVVNHLAHLADAFSTLGRTLVALEDLARTRRTRLDRAGDIALAETIAVADIHGRRSWPVATGSL